MTAPILRSDSRAAASDTLDPGATVMTPCPALDFRIWLTSIGVPPPVACAVKGRAQHPVLSSDLIPIGRSQLRASADQRLGKAGQPRHAAIIGMADQPEAAGQPDLIGQNPHQFGGGGQRKVMHHAQARPLPQKVQLHRDRVGRERDRRRADFGLIVQFLVKDQVGDIADKAVVLQIFGTG